LLLSADDEQLTGLYTNVDDNLVMPFSTQVLGVEVTVRWVELRSREIVAVFHRGRIRQPIGILDLCRSSRRPAARVDLFERPPGLRRRAVDRGVSSLGG
jgi:hypothetical protein